MLRGELIYTWALQLAAERVGCPFPSQQSRGVSGPPWPHPRGLLCAPPAPCPAQPYLGEPVLFSEVGPDRGPLRLALGKLGISLHPANHTRQLPAAAALVPWV